MRRGFLTVLAAAAWLVPGLGVATTIDRIVQLSAEATNFDIDAAPNGDLHMSCRVGAGSQTNFKKISYFKYTKATDMWSDDFLVFQGDALNVSADIDTNQPNVAYDELNDGAWIIFSGNVRRDNAIDAYFVQPPAVPFRVDLLRLPPVKEIRAVDIAVAPDGHLWGCWNFTSLGDPNINGIYCNNDGGSVERGTGRDATGEGLSVALGPGGRPHIMTTFGTGTGGRNGAWSPRDGLGGGAWIPNNLNFGIPGSAGKVSCLDTNDNNKLDCAAVTADAGSALRITFAYSLARSGGPASVVKASALARWGVTVSPGEFNSEGIKYARSAQGKEAISYAMDSDGNGGLDLTIVLVKPAGVDWPQTPFVDANGDNIHDEVGGTGQTPRQYFTTGNPELQHVFEGPQGRAVLAFITGETPAVGFSGEDLWVAYHIDDPVPNLLPRGTRVAKITVGLPVPDASVAALLLLLGAFSALLLGLGTRRQNQPLRPA